MRQPAFVIIVLVLVLVFPSACSQKTEEEKVKSVIEAVRKAAEKGDLGGVLKHVSNEYRDPEGHDYRGMRSLLFYYFLHYRKISVFITNVDVIMTEKTNATFQAVLSGGTGAGADVLPESLGAYRFRVSFRKESGDWKVTTAHWEAFSAPEN